MQQENSRRKYWTPLITKFCVLLGIYSIVRVLFFICNYDFFSDAYPVDILKSFFVGMRFDIATLAIFNFPILILWSFPIKFLRQPFLLKLCDISFFILNFLALLPNIVDVKLFGFTFRRMTIEIFSQSDLLSENVSIYLDMISRYWYVVVVGIILTWMLFYASFFIKFSCVGSKIYKRDYAYFFISMSIFVICFRGGFQQKPLKPVDSNIYSPTTQLSYLVNNSAFNIFHTRKKRHLPKFEYFDQSDPKLSAFSPLHFRDPRKETGKNNKFLGKFKGKNVFIIILESFSAEHVGALDRTFKSSESVSLTPFLDELIEKSYVLDGFANGTVSVDALTSIVFGIPPLLECSYITSSYSENSIDSIVSTLKADGYKTLFFYGGKPNSCNFGSAMKKATIDYFFCENEYDGPKSDISGWGVYDEEFLQFVVKKINGLTESESKCPFLSILFTLSSHHPFLYPKRLHGKFSNGFANDPLRELISYTDYALRKFFETAKKTDWYKNTIFVLVADHISGPLEKYYKTSLGGYSIPLMFFDPSGELIGKSKSIAQQIDIMPSILDLVGSEQSYFCFGSSLFDESSPKFSVSCKNGIYQIISQDFVLRFDGRNVIELFQRSDFLLVKNLVDNPDFFEVKEHWSDFLKSFLQHYSASIRNNKMKVSELNKMKISDVKK